MSAAAVLTRPPQRKIDWRLAAELRGKGLTYQQIADRTGAVSSESVRVGLQRRHVTVGIRTALLAEGDRMVKESLAKLSEETKTSLASTVLEQSIRLGKVKSKPNIRNIKKMGEAIEPLARSAKIIHGWGEQQSKASINLNVLGSVRIDDLTEKADCVPDTPTGSVPSLPTSTDTPQEPESP